MATLGSLFSYTSPSVKKLLGYKQGANEEKCSEKLVDLLVVELERKSGAVEELEKALESSDEATKCVTVTHALEDRFRVLNYNGL